MTDPVNDTTEWGYQKTEMAGTGHVYVRNISIEDRIIGRYEYDIRQGTLAAVGRVRLVRK